AAQRLPPLIRLPGGIPGIPDAILERLSVRPAGLEAAALRGVERVIRAAGLLLRLLDVCGQTRLLLLQLRALDPREVQGSPARVRADGGRQLPGLLRRLARGLVLPGRVPQLGEVIALEPQLDDVGVRVVELAELLDRRVREREGAGPLQHVLAEELVEAVEALRGLRLVQQLQRGFVRDAEDAAQA